MYTAKHNLNNSLLGTIGILILSGLLIGLLIFYIGYVLSNTLLKPVSVLTGHIANYETGSFSPIKINTQNSEIQLLIKVYNEMSNKISEMIKKNIQIETEKNKHELLAKNLELEALQTQINPHFIYNTLTIINGYAIENDIDDITEMTLSLSSLLRYSLGKVWEKTTLNDEIIQAHNYFSIQKNRQACMPIININIDGYENCQTTRLFLQPLLENIFLHAFPNGITPSSNILIKAYSSESDLFVDVSDNGIGMDENYLHHKHSNDNHIGLFNTHRRIQLEYGNAYGCFISKNKTGGTTITAKFPLNRI